jgi:hypothetical protein
MVDVSISLWLPVGRANFYSVTANGWLRNDSGGTWSSKKIRNPDDPDYIPTLQCSVLRRLLEVLPLSFGYEPTGRCALATEDDERSRPVSVTMTMPDIGASLDESLPPTWLKRREAANLDLHLAGARGLRMRADEQGNYTFTATFAEAVDRDVARQALIKHAGEVFGGAFEVKRFEAQPRKGLREGASAVRRYNGLTDAPTGSVRDDTVAPPAGALTFFQLNTLVEGICNETLWPAVFFERYGFMTEWQGRKETAVTLLHTIGQIVNVLHVEANAETLAGQITTLRHFLAVTSRESLQRIKWSVESVRRSLLDEMMSVLHRQSRLIQLDLGAIQRERSPELAVDASESQLRGYVMLAAAKMPLIANVYEVANLTVDHITFLAGPEGLDSDAHELRVQLKQWKTLLDGLANNVRSLENAVEQAWMERLLYEEQQSRSEQEAMAEIERSRFGRPSARSVGKSAIDAFNLMIAVLATLFVVVTTDFPNTNSDIDWWRQIGKLWPIAVVAVVFYLVIPGGGFLFRWLRDRRGVNTNYSYEFAFLLDEPTDPEVIHRYITDRKRQRIRQTAAQLAAALNGVPRADRPAARRRPLKGLSLIRLGSGRIERITADSSSLKLHSVVTFRVAPFKYARFEVVKEILANRVSDQPRYYLHQVRMFGDSPRAIAHEDVVELVDIIHSVVALPLASDKRVEDPLSLLREIYLPQAERAAPRR